MAPVRRLVRRQPLMERLKAYLNPLDFLLWLSEELETSDWGQLPQYWAVPIGIGMNMVMMIARANSGKSPSKSDDVFGDSYGEGGWLGWFAAFTVHFLSLLSFANAVYTFSRKRHYRLFEASIDAPPSTPSAHRVRVDSSPMSSSPLRFLSNMISDSSAASRAHPDSHRDVWELSVWDPTPLCLKMFCLFSPGHVVVYWVLLPTAPEDVRPSTTVATTIALAALLSAQLFQLQSNFSQQSKDTSFIHKEVLNEYDIKYVHPRTQPVMRDVATQFSEEHDSFDGVDEYSPVTVVNRGFHTNPNPSYLAHVDPDAARSRARESPQRKFASGPSSFQTPAQKVDFSSPLQQRTAIGQPAMRGSLEPENRRPNFRASTGMGDGGNLGVYSHAQSPLKKSASTNFAPANQRLDRIRGSPARRESGRF